MTIPINPLTAARAEAVFASMLPTGSHPTRREVNSAIRAAIRVHGGIRECAVVLAGEYGERPELAVPRMRWALALVHTVYPAPAENRRHRPLCAATASFSFGPS